MQWLFGHRILYARQLLETTDQDVERIARNTGFSSGAALRTHFVKATGVSPTAYRKTFRVPL